MRFIVKPDDSTAPILLETLQYRAAWQAHGPMIRKAFREVTRLEFQQSVITARVYAGEQSDAGANGRAMRLAGDNRPSGYKLATIVHELSHRLLGGNALNTTSLGLGGERAYTDEVSEVDHRHVYLMEYDVLHAALGNEGEEMFRQYEQLWRRDPDSPHEKALKWVLSLSYEQRQAALRWLTSKKVTRDHWKDVDFDNITSVPIPVWKREMEAVTQSIKKESISNAS